MTDEMLAFVNSTPFCRPRPVRKESTRVNISGPSRSRFQVSGRRRRQPRACASPLQSDESESATQDVLFDDMVSDDDFVVLDGKDVGKLIEELQRTGGDQIGTIGADDMMDEEGLSEDFLTLAEKRSDEWNGRAPVEDVVESEKGLATESLKKSETESEKGKVEETESSSESERQVGMQYFNDDNVQFMPSWAAEAFQTGEHRELEEAALRIMPTTGGQRLHDIVARKKYSDLDALESGNMGGDGIVDCSVRDVGADYSIPVEFVIDAMIHYGVPVPILPDQSVRDSMTTEEIEQLLTLITSFDAKDLADRYSDRTISELAEVYDVTVEQILGVCQSESLYICSGETTRLSVVREDRILDIILKGAALGQPYPSLLQGLEG